MQYNTVRSATAIAAQDTILLRIHKDNFDEICDVRKFRQSRYGMSTTSTSLESTSSTATNGLETVNGVGNSVGIAVVITPMALQVGV